MGETKARSTANSKQRSYMWSFSFRQKCCAVLQVPGVWELLGAAVVCSTTMLLGWDEKRQHDKQQQQQPQQTDNDSADEEENNEQNARS